MSLTIRELASHLNLSPTTVSDALKEEPTGYVASATRDRIRREAHRLGYRPNLHARRLTRRRADNVAVLFSALGWFQGSLPAKVIEIQDALSADGFEVTFHRAIHPETPAALEALASFIGQRPALLLLNAHLPEIGPLFEEATRYVADGGALIVFDDTLLPETRALLPANGWDEVVFDRQGNTRLATEYLLSLGHRRLGLFLNPENWPGGERAIGAREALVAAGGDPERDFTVYPVKTIAGFKTGSDIGDHWLKEPAATRPTGMVLLNDETATGFISRVRAAGFEVPGDVSVVGHDAMPWSEHLAVPLTTVTHPTAGIASAVVEAARTRLKLGADVPTRRIVIGSELIVRASSAPPNPRRNS